MMTTNSQLRLEDYNIRQCTVADEDSAIAVCLLTGDAGNDATMLYDDPKLLGYRYVSPYIHLCPELAFVLEDSNGHICGYVLAALNSDTFNKRFADEWLPKMKQLYPNIPSNEGRKKRDEDIVRGFHNDSVLPAKIFDSYPSHFHIDLVPKAQGKGYGTKMISLIERELKRLGSIGVHLEMAANNMRAFRFYTKLGFQVLAQDDENIWLGKTFL